MKTVVTFLGFFVVIALLAVITYLIWGHGERLATIEEKISTLKERGEEEGKEGEGEGEGGGGGEERKKEQRIAYNQRVRIEEKDLQAANINKVSFTPSKASKNNKQSVSFMSDQNSEEPRFINVDAKGNKHIDSYGNELELPLSTLPDGGIVFTFPHFPAEFEPRILELSEESYLRDSVIVEFFNEDNKLLVKKEYSPYGSVVTGEINVSIKNDKNSQQDCEQSIEELLGKREYKGIDINTTTYEDTKQGNEQNAAYDENQAEGQKDTDPNAYKDNSTNCLVNIFVKEETIDTEKVINDLNENIANEETIVSRNIILNANNGDNGFDPTCKQTKNWLKPFASKGGYGNPSKSDISDVVRGAPASRSAGTPQSPLEEVTVVLIGGGVGQGPNRPSWLSQYARNFIGEDHDPNGDHLNVDPNAIFDEFECLNPKTGKDEWVGHDTHIAQIIQDILTDQEKKQVTILPLKVCDHRGSCATNNIIEALKYLKYLQTTGKVTGRVIVNISLGGPIPDPTLHKVLKESSSPCSNPRDCTQYLVIASAGNHPEISEHYPADYAFSASGRALATTNYNFTKLDNLLSVAATAKKGKEWKLANFNRGQSNLKAPGVHLCPATHQNSCSNPGSVGLIGTSFAAASATGLATHYAQFLPLFAPPNNNVYTELNSETGRLKRQK